jgi:steroid delta-isomerase-like uncharacterized protein
MTDTARPTVEGLIDGVRRKSVTRAQFMSLLAGAGASAAGVATLLSSTTSDAANLPRRQTTAQKHDHAHHQQLHHQHVLHQSGATKSVGSHANPGKLSAEQQKHLQAMLNDYADNAVVEDPLFDAAFVGKRAIAARKVAEAASMRGVAIEVANRYSFNNQVVAEWVVRGTHAGNFMGFKATGRQIEVHGVTVVTRENGKIVRESLHYDVADLYRQMAA